MLKQEEVVSDQEAEAVEEERPQEELEAEEEDALHSWSMETLQLEQVESLMQTVQTDQQVQTTLPEQVEAEAAEAEGK
jgi:hypothetical protein